MIGWPFNSCFFLFSTIVYLLPGWLAEFDNGKKRGGNAGVHPMSSCTFPRVHVHFERVCRACTKANARKRSCTCIFRVCSTCKKAYSRNRVCTCILRVCVCVCSVREREKWIACFQKGVLFCGIARIFWDETWKDQPWLRD